MQERPKTGMAEQGSAPQTKEQDGNSQPVGAGTCGLGRVQGYSLDVWGWDQESQGTDEAGLGKGHEE